MILIASNRIPDTEKNMKVNIGNDVAVNQSYDNIGITIFKTAILINVLHVVSQAL
jgi:hypothetical protein